MKLTVDYKFPGGADPVFKDTMEVEVGDDPYIPDIRKAVAAKLREEQHMDDISHRGVYVLKVEEWTTDCPECGKEVYSRGNISEQGDHDFGCKYKDYSGWELLNEELE